MLFQTIRDLVASLGVATPYLPIVTTVTMMLGVILIAMLAFYLIFNPGRRMIMPAIKHSKTDWDNRLLSKGMMFYIALIISMSFVVLCIPFTLQAYPSHIPAMKKAGSVVMMVIVFLFANKVIHVVYRGLRDDEVDMAGLSVLRNFLTVIIGVIIGLMIVCEITGKNVMVILGSLGAAAAVISFLFKDDLTGMFAGMRLVANKMIKHNDWIIVPKYNANGRVTDVRLSAVKVRNWDNSISSVPPHALLSEGFQNMEQMLNKGTRQLKKSINVDIHSVRLLSTLEMEAFANEPWTRNLDLTSPCPNITLWRRYLKHFISYHELTELQEFCMVKELQPQSEGIPVEIFFFVRCLEWGDFEQLQADIMDLILVSMHRFGLKPFQFSHNAVKARASAL
ncbi:MAG: mechanosensitive ion channel family protein [Muribaculum sp.]|nr:mechanosensitive ion channel family protein [Muribaculum sp.]